MVQDQESQVHLGPPFSQVFEAQVGVSMLLSPTCFAFPLPVYLSFGAAAGFAFYATLSTQQLVTSFTAAGFTFNFIHSAVGDFLSSCLPFTAAEVTFSLMCSC